MPMPEHATLATTSRSLRLAGRLDAAGVGPLWREAEAALERLLTTDKAPVLDCAEASYLDGAGAALCLRLSALARERGGELTIQGLAPEHARLLALFDPALLVPAPDHATRPRNLAEEVGAAGLQLWRDVRALVAFVGEMTAALVHCLLRPATLRGLDVLRTCEEAGANALPIVLLIGFLMGLVLSFQSAIPMRRFGADIYIADMLGLSILRELGALVTAILLAGRTGSAFAAEIGTMKINEEVDALRTMGLDPLRFLAVPRMLGALLVTPLLTAFFNLAALVGGAVVVTGFGYSLETYLNRVFSAVTVEDFAGGMVKVMIFAVLVAAIGCYRGLETGGGASAVGHAATAAVVSGLVLIAVADGVMAVLFYTLGI